MFERIVGLNVTDDEEYQLYREGMTPILASYGGVFSYDFRVSEVLISKSDARINRVFSIEFPDREAMESFYADPAYVAVQQLHFAKSVSDRTLISLHEKD
jgi:uncharacterized protein (DUF1330 family)